MADLPPGTTPGPGTPPPMPYLRGSDLLLVLILGLVTVRAGGMLAASMIMGAKETGQEDTANLALLGAGFLMLQSGAILGALWLVAHRWRRVTWAEMGLRPAEQPWYPRAAAIGFAAVPLTMLVNSAQQALFDQTADNPQLDLIAPGSFSWSGFAAMLVAAGMAVPFAEELAFRGLFQGWLRLRWSFWPAAVTVAACFSVLHGILALVPAIFVLGLILAVLREKSGSIWPSVVTHGIFNATAIVLLYALLSSGVPLDGTVQEPATGTQGLP